MRISNGRDRRHFLGRGLSGRTVSANPIERACNQSDRPGVSNARCAAASATAADMTLSQSDMREGRGSSPIRAARRRSSCRTPAGTMRSGAAGRNSRETAEALCS
jgi:hypothetical protein